MGGPGEIIDEDCIFFRRASNLMYPWPLNGAVREEDGNFCFYDDSHCGAITFVMSGGELTSVIYDE